MAQQVEKRCRVCGDDVSTRKRTRDAAGKYYCQPCYQAARPAESETSEQQVDFAALEQMTTVAATSLFTCPTCSGMFTEERMDPRGVCRRCATTPPAPSRTQSRVPPRAVKNVPAATPRRTKAIIASVVAVGAVVAVALAVVGSNRRKDATSDASEQDAIFARHQARETAEAVAAAPMPIETTAFLANMETVSVDCWTDTQGRVVFHKRAADWEGKPISINGKTSPNGLFTHPPEGGKAIVSYSLGGTCRRFTAEVGIADSGDPQPKSPVTFSVVGDGRVLWTSKAIGLKGQTDKCDIDVAAVQRIELVAQVSGSHYFASAVWLEPRVVGSGLSAIASASNSPAATPPAPPETRVAPNPQPGPPFPVARKEVAPNPFDPKIEETVVSLAKAFDGFLSTSAKLDDLTAQCNVAQARGDLATSEELIAQAIEMKRTLDAWYEKALNCQVQLEQMDRAQVVAILANIQRLNPRMPQQTKDQLETIRKSMASN